MAERGKKPRPDPKRIPAGELCAIHIGLLIRLRQFNEQRKVGTIVTAELRQVYHVGTETHLTVGEGGSQEFNLNQNEPVVLWPMADYSDVPVLLGADDPSLVIEGELA